MTPDQAIQQARAGTLRPVYLVVGEERLLVDRVVAALREAATRGGVAGFNEDKFNVPEASAKAIVGAARQLPMMAARRFVLARGLERWERKAAAADDERGESEPQEGRSPSPLDELAEYAKAPVDTTVMVLVASKLHGQRRLVTAAKKGDFLVPCDPLPRAALPGWIARAAKERGHAIDPEVAELLAEIAGPELGYVDDALERLSLYVGAGRPITEDAVARTVTRVRQSTVWDLVEALGRRRLGPALAALADAFDARDEGLRMLGAIAYSVRQLATLESALAAGASIAEAAAAARVPPFKVQALSQTVRGMPRGTLARWLRLLAEADRALKGSRRSAQAVLETLVVDMCR